MTTTHFRKVLFCYIVKIPRKDEHEVCTAFIFLSCKNPCSKFKNKDTIFNDIPESSLPYLFASVKVHLSLLGSNNPFIFIPDKVAQ